MKKLNLLGHRFGKLVVSEQAENQGKHTRWVCVCDCGKSVVVSTCNLRTSHIQSCGCLHNEMLIKRNIKHGHSIRGKRAPEYTVWATMLSRCNNPKNKCYERYGGRGITVCDSWLSYENFIADMGSRPSSSHSIERIDNNSGYYKENCRWATMYEQTRNRRNNLSGYYRGFHYQAARDLEPFMHPSLNYHILESRLSDGWDVERAVNEPRRLKP